MTTDSEREQLLEQIQHLANYVQRGEGWRIGRIEASVRRMIRELRVAEDQLYDRLRKSYGGTDNEE
ncbi:MAG: hypothetical protein AB7V39_00445 [Nitrospiraceae bacterium]